MSRLLISLAIGLLATAGLFLGSSFVVAIGFAGIGQAIFWQEQFLQAFPPWHGLVSPQSPLFDSLTLLGAFVLGIFVYSLIAYVWLRWRAPNSSSKPTPLRGAA